MVKPVEAACGAMSANLPRLRRYSEKRLADILARPAPQCAAQCGVRLVPRLGRSLGEVGITLMLGGNIIGKTNTLSLEIYNAVFSGEFERALILSAIIGLFSLTIFIALKRLSAV